MSMSCSAALGAGISGNQCSGLTLLDSPIISWTVAYYAHFILDLKPGFR